MSEPRTSPFDQILQTETEQERRVHDALAALEQERVAEEDALRERQAIAVEQSRASAREELVQYKNTQLPAILKDAEERSAAERARIEREASPRVDAAAQAVVDAAFSDTFPSLL
jgi:hypothetical protein